MEKDRGQENAEQGHSQHATEYGGSQGAPHLGSRPLGQNEGHDTENERQ